MDSFLPKEAKEPKSKSNYTKLVEGMHRLRVMSSAIVGYEAWKIDGEKKSPVRYSIDDAPPFGPDGKEPKYFWAFVVWNYGQERLQIMEITQKTIRTALQAYVDNEAWGDPKTYDIVINRKGTKLEDTEYTVVANPHTDVDEAVLQTYKDAKINLEDWREGKDPFTREEETNSDGSPTPTI